MNLRRKNAVAERGSVLMETVLVLPLYIAFFSGIFMLGDLESGRNRLTAGDRFAVWASGNRHAESDDGQVKSAADAAFFPSGEFAEGTGLKSFSSANRKVDFYSVVRGASELKLVLPVWAVQSRKGALKFFADIGTSVDEDKWDNISFRAREIDGKYTHSVLMRGKYDERDRSGRELAQGAPLWYVEYRTAYVARNGEPNDRPSSPGSAVSVSEYVRNPQYEQWSR